MSDDGSIHAVTQNPAVPISTQKDFLNWKRTGLCDEDVVDRLRPRTVPAGYPYHKWTQDAGKSNNAYRHGYNRLLLIWKALGTESIQVSE